ncbi:DUF1640 domain-containing protein [Thioalbus denitrificans]|uniref:Uncharacterized protein DUF1640 n=1 Tax=Thioalbus denitrificans TaxID=547122 RepID=A0A369C2B0_9GAMM|nr:DUF1640 domain-containing protein [Thioalbus denitrificans]RCX28029.1 uncharacterized protein DUF1640 [Thioalbus denitrificans]
MSVMHAFDTLAFAKKLKNAGYTEAQAEALAEAQGEVFREMLESTLATKDDVRDMATKTDIEDLKAATKADIARLEAATKADIAALDHKIDLVANRLTIRLGGMLVVAVGALAAMRFFG